MIDPINEKERALRRELSKRTISMPSLDNRDDKSRNDPEHIRKIGIEISALIQDEKLEKAQERLAIETEKYPDEPGLLNLQFALDMMLKPFGNYEKAKESTGKAMELAIEKNSPYFARVAINNMALDAQKEGHAEFSKAMYLAAHFIDKAAIPPIANIAGWYSRQGELENAQKWIDKLLSLNPKWPENDEITTFLTKDEMLGNLRTFEPFINKVLSQIKKEE